MKKIILAVCLSSLSFGAFSSDWVNHQTFDDFTDEKSCLVYSEKGLLDGGITFYAHTTSGKQGAIASFRKSRISGVGIKYRVDKNETVELGYKYEFQSEDDTYVFRNDEYNKIVNDFSNGENVVIEIISSNKYVENKKVKLSLKGFKEIHDQAVECK